MTNQPARFNFALRPDSWGFRLPRAIREADYQKMLDEMVIAGYTGTELVRTLPAYRSQSAGDELTPRKLKLLGSFVPRF